LPDGQAKKQLARLIIMSSWQILTTIKRRSSSKNELFSSTDSSPLEDKRLGSVQSWPIIVPARRSSTESYPVRNKSKKSQSARRTPRRHSFPANLGKVLSYVSPFRPRQNFGMAATSVLLAALEEKQTKIQIDGTTKKWISLLDIRSLVKVEEVEKILRETTGINHSPSHTKELKDFIFGKALRLFALLVLLEHVQMLELFYQNRFGDEMFPVRELPRTSYSNRGWTIESIGRDKSRVSYKGREVTNREIESICSLFQWEVFVPVFDETNPVNDFNPLCQMPFLREEETEKKNVTNFSIVRHFVMHRSHLCFSNIGQIVRPGFSYKSVDHLLPPVLTGLGRNGG
jgi:hypothetical protein